MLSSDEGQQFFIVVEENFLTDSGNLIVDLYYVFDIVYPQPLYPVLIFIQHFLCNLKDNQNIPNSI